MILRTEVLFSIDDCRRAKYIDIIKDKTKSDSLTNLYVLNPKFKKINFHYIQAFNEIHLSVTKLE